MAKYDPEQFVRDITAIFKAGTNTEISAIDTEKGDFTLDQIATNAWYTAGIPEVFSYPVAAFIGISSMQTPDTVQAAEDSRISIQIKIGVPDSGSSTDEAILYRLLRYQRALNQVANKNFSNGRFKGHTKIEVKSLIPAQIITPFSKSFPAAGIEVTGTFS